VNKQKFLTLVLFSNAIPTLVISHYRGQF